MWEERRTWVRKLRGSWREDKELFEFFQHKIKSDTETDWIPDPWKSNQFLKHKPRWFTDVNKCNFIGLKGTVSMYTSWGFGKSSFWASINTHMFLDQWTQIYKIHSQHSVMTNRYNYHFWGNEEIIAHYNKFSLHFFVPENYYTLTSPNPYFGRLGGFPLNVAYQLLSVTHHKKVMYKVMQREFLIIICIKEIQLIWINLRMRIWSASTAL